MQMNVSIKLIINFLKRLHDSLLTDIAEVNKWRHIYLCWELTSFKPEITADLKVTMKIYNLHEYGNWIAP